MSDYNFMMETRLSPEQFQVLSHLSHAAAAQGVNLYLVGGAVRDLTFGQQVVRNLDFALEGNPQRLLRALGSKLASGGGAAAAAIVSQRLDSRLNSAEVGFANGVRMKLSMCRHEAYPKPGRRPVVSPAMIFDDLKRRDFSVNAMAVSLHPNSRGLLLDPTNGAADIEKQELRALHSRSFLEDPSRLYRLLRLGLRLGFKPEARTAAWMDSALENRVWERMDPDQQGRELQAILREENPGKVLKLMAERKLLVGLDRKLGSVRLPYEQFAKIRGVVRAVPGADAFLLNFHCLVAKLGTSQRNRLAKKIIVDRKAVREALNLEGQARKLARLLSSAKAALPSQVYTLLSAQPQSLLLFLLANYRQARIQKRIKDFLFKYPLVRAKLPRAELQTLGLEPGPKFEKVLQRLFLDQLDGKIKTHAQLLKEFRQLAGLKEPVVKPPARPAPARGKKAGKHPTDKNKKKR